MPYYLRTIISTTSKTRIYTHTFSLLGVTLISHLLNLCTTKKDISHRDMNSTANRASFCHLLLKA